MGKISVGDIIAIAMSRGGGGLALANAITGRTKPQMQRGISAGDIIAIAMSRGGGTEYTVSGVAPLSLVDAVAGKIKSLTQYGKCSQASTPAPSSPVDIMCNNGALTLVDDELPIGYKRIESIRFGENTYYETGEKLYGTDVVTITLSDFVSTGQNLFGCYSGTDGINFSMYIYGTATGQAYWRYGMNLYRPTVGSTADRTITFGAGGTTGFKTNVSYSTVDFETDTTARIGSLPNSTSAKYDGLIVGDITVSTRLKYIPCERTSDSVIGYYEAINGVFLEPNGDAPVAGAYDNSHLHLAVVGTPEVLTVENENASVVDLFAVGSYVDTQEIISGTVMRNTGFVVLDGTESWTRTAANCFTTDINDAESGVSNEIYCTHFPYNATAVASDCCRITDTGQLFFCDMSLGEDPTATEFETWLAAQYAAGTPVIVLYPLADETTEQETAQPLNTIAGTNVVSVVANVSGIELSATYLKK